MLALCQFSGMPAIGTSSPIVPCYQTKSFCYKALANQRSFGKRLALS